MIYDIIGDIHGQADKLIGLLNQLGYRHNAKENGKGCFVPPANHKAVFIGDLIDRGKQEIKTLEIVFAMLDNGVAYAVMGNHEYNALAFATLDENGDDNNSNHYLREHKPSNVAQHQAFIEEVGFDTEVHHYWLSRFYQLPLWLELPEVCFVHACWDSQAMGVLKPLLTDNNCLTYHGLQATGQKDSPEYNALERVLKGVETRLPEGYYYLDKEGTKRRKMRVQWWLAHPDTPLSGQKIHDIARATPKDLAHIPHDTFADEIDFIFDNVKPVFIGHYWLTGTPAILSDKVVCVDYSAAVDTGFLTAYQFDTDNPTLSSDNFVQFKG